MPGALFLNGANGLQIQFDFRIAVLGNGSVLVCRTTRFEHDA